MATPTDMKATRDPLDPFGDVRDADEARLLRLMKARLNGQLRDVMSLLGDPPEWSNLDYAFWEGEAGRMLADLRPEMERMALHAAVTPVVPASVPVLWEEAVLFREAADWARQYAGKLVQGITDNTREGVGRAVQGFVDTPGRTIGQLRDELAPLFGESRAQRIAVTETTRAYSEGMNLVHQQISRAGIQMDKVWQTANDEKVCPICGPNHGKTEKQGWTVRGAPAHPNCRCWVTLALPEMAGAQTQRAPQFTSVPEAERWMSERNFELVRDADVPDDVALTYMNAWAKAYNTMDEYGLPVGSVRTGGDRAGMPWSNRVHLRGKDGSPAAMTAGGDTVYANTRNLQAMRDTIASDNATAEILGQNAMRDFASRDVAEMFVHEFGHNAALGTDGWKRIGDALWHEIQTEAVGPGAHFASLPSAYCWQSESEMFAESFLSVITGRAGHLDSRFTDMVRLAIREGWGK